MFECKVKYEKINDKGKLVNVSENYLLDAVNFSDAETRINNELASYIAGDFSVEAIKRACYSEIVPISEGDILYKARVIYISLDEAAGKEKKTSVYILVSADSVEKATGKLNEYLKDTISDYTIKGVVDSELSDYFAY